MLITGFLAVPKSRIRGGDHVEDTNLITDDRNLQWQPYLQIERAIVIKNFPIAGKQINGGSVEGNGDVGSG